MGRFEVTLVLSVACEDVKSRKVKLLTNTIPVDLVQPEILSVDKVHQYRALLETYRCVPIGG
jgi:hypothetical protein